MENRLQEIKPKEGDIVRVQLSCCPGFKRTYLLVIWPNEYSIRYLGYGNINALSQFIIDLDGKLSKSGIFGFNKNDTLYKPTVSDMFEVLKMLTENNLIYNRKTKKISKKV